VTDHPGPLLSAYADGDLDPKDRAEVERHVAGCEPCRRQLEVVEEVRRTLAGLPVVDPPGWFLPAVLRAGPQPERVRARRLRLGAANVAAAAAVLVVLVGAGLHRVVPTATMDPASLLSAHEEVADARLEPGPPADGLRAPATLAASWSLAGHRELAGMLQAVYRDGERWLSVFAEPGHLDPADLPADARPVTGGGDRAWSVAGGKVLVVDQGDAVLAVVGPTGSPALAGALAAEAPDDGVLDRVQAAARGVLRAFSLG
jgi:hypothetical protein